LERVSNWSKRKTITMQIYNQILEILPKSFWKDKSVINKNTELEEDLGITGDDADEFLYDYSKKFNVDMSDFVINDYFLAEGEDPFQIVSSWLLGKKIKKNGRKRLTLGHLEDAVKKGKLL